jgi:hypothetical protein
MVDVPKAQMVLVDPGAIRDFDTGQEPKNAEAFIRFKTQSSKAPSLAERVAYALERQGQLSLSSAANCAHPVTQALVSIAEGATPSPSVTVEFYGAHDSRRLLRSVSFSIVSKLLRVVKTDKKTRIVQYSLDSELALPEFGRVCITTTSHRRKFVYSFNLDSPQGSPYKHAVPLYNQSGFTVINREGTPTTTMWLVFTEGRNLTGLSFEVLLEPSVSNQVYSPRTVLTCDPTFSVEGAESRKQARACLKSVRPVPGSVVTELDAQIARIVQRASCDCRPGQCACRDRDTRLVDYSWSISHLDDVVAGHRGTERFMVGEAGEPLIAYAVLKRIAERYGARQEEVLRGTDGLDLMISDAGLGKLRAGLSVAYAKAGRLPTVHELLTHTAGLPNSGCLDSEVCPLALSDLFKDLPPAPTPTAANLEERIGHQLTHRVRLHCFPGTKVYRSKLGYTILGLLLGPLAEAVRSTAASLGMSATRLVQGTNPGDWTHPVSQCIESSTQDLCRLTAAFEAAAVDPTVHQHIRKLITHAFLERDEDTCYHTVTAGGMAGATLRFKSQSIMWAAPGVDGVKKSVSIFYAVGQRPGESAVLFGYVPSMRCGFAFAAGMNIERLWGGRTHSEMGYGKGSRTKCYGIKHFLKDVICSTASTLTKMRGNAFYLSAESELAVVRNKVNYPPCSSTHKAYCDGLHRVPQTSVTGPLDAWKWQPLLASDLFAVGKEVAFFPLGIAATLAHKAVDVAEALVGAPSIHLSRKQDGRFYLREKGVEMQLGWDPTMSIRFGTEYASRIGITSGGFRVSAHDHSGYVGAALSLNPFEDPLDPSKRHISINYGGCTYVSGNYLRSRYARNAAEAYIGDSMMEGGSDGGSGLNLTPWKQAHSDARPAVTGATHQRPVRDAIAANGGAIAAAALGGAALGLAATGAGPYGYGPYGPYYYPPPPPYWGWRRRRRWW